ncbi:MAG: class I SAM-dependent methyltransferase [Leptolyngbyaceae cyanobacterium SM2_5_2]|nr:class I SAM-dependent methyltransferase [Leptolyngbyaceae cyanobacterium SM2_5_2]
MKTPTMKTLTLTPEAVLQGYDAVSQLYPHIPPLSHWRAWEYAAYQNYKISGHILDLGCGDGQYFRLLWPHADSVVGVDMNPAVVDLAQQSGVYCNVHTTLAHQIPEPDNSFDWVFANCSLEHMDDLAKVLSEIYRCLKPGGKLLCSVVTNRFIEWSLLPQLITIAGFDEIATNLQNDFLQYHHLTNALSIGEWQKQFIQAGLSLVEHIPILPLYNSSIFLLMDTLWHVKQKKSGEIGDVIFSVLSTNEKFPSAFRHIFDGLLEMEADWYDCSGAVFLAHREG